MSRMGRLGQLIVVWVIVAMLASTVPVPAGAAQPGGAIAPPDLAAMVLTPFDLASVGMEGYRRAPGEEVPIGLPAGAMSGRTGMPQDDITAVLEEAGWQRQYALNLKLLADVEDSNSVLRIVRSMVTVYDSTEGAAQAFTFLEDESINTQPELYQDLPSNLVGEESELSVEYWENDQGAMIPVALSLTFRTGPYLAKVFIQVAATPVRDSEYEILDPTPGSADIHGLESAATIMLQKIGDISAVEGPQPGVLALRYDIDPATTGDVVILEADSAYSLYGGEPVPGAGWTDAEIDESRATAQAEGQLHSYTRFYLVTLGAVDLAWTWAVVDRYVDDNAAQAVLDGKLANYADRDNLQELSGIPNFGDDMLALSFTVTGSNGDVRTAYRIFTRLGNDIVATLFFPVESELPVDPAIMLMEAQVGCYQAGSCNEPVLFPAGLFLPGEADADAASTTPESSTTYVPANQDQSDDAEEQGTAETDETTDAGETPEPVAPDDAESGFYESPAYGFTLEYDPDTWTVAGEDEDGDDPYDMIYLTNGVSVVGLFGDPDYDEDELESCIDDYASFLDGEEEVSDVDRMRGRRNSGSDDDRAWATYTYLYDDEERVRSYECRALDDGVTLVILHDAPETDYDDEVDQLEELLEGFEA